MALAASAVAMALRAAFDFGLGESHPFIFSFAAIAVVAAYGGWGPALVAIVISYAGGRWFFTAPRQAFATLDLRGLVALASYGLTVGVITTMAVRMRRAERRARENGLLLASEREQWQVTLRCIGDAVVATDVVGAVTFLNPVAEKLTGWPDAEAHGRPVTEVMPLFQEGTGAPTANPVEQVLRERIVVEMANHTVLRQRGGAEIPIEDSAAPIFAPDGSLRGAIIVFHDVTARRSRDRALRASELRSRAIIDTAIDGVLLMDSRGTIVDWNPPAERIFGWRREEVIGAELAMYIVPERLREAHRRGLAHLLATGEGPVLGRRMELPAMRRDGSEFPVELSINPLPLAGEAMFVGFIRDISERKAAEGELEERARLSALRAEIAAHLASEAELGASLHGTCELLVRHLDAAFARVWLLDETESVLVLRASAGLYTHLDGPHARVPVGQFKIGRIAQNRRTHLTNDVAHDPNISDPEWAAREGMVAFAGYPLIVDARLVGVVALFSKHALSAAVLGDLAPIADAIAVSIERRAAETALRAEKERAEVASSAKDNFLAALSHELRTPLMPVLMTANSLSEDERLPEEVRSSLAMIGRNIALEARLIDDLLDLTRISKGKLPLREELCDVHSLLGLAVGIVRDEAREKPINLEMDLAARKTGLWADPARLQQVFWNLLRNAIKFTPPGGRVTVRSRDETDGRLRIEVSDTGIGLPPEDVEKIFRPFEQAGRENNHQFGGLGLGLAIARAIVGLHGGGIIAQSEGLGKGATFIVELPGSRDPASGLAEPPGPPGTDPGDDAAGSPEKLHLLVVEDHEPTLTVLRRLLTRAGHEVVAASGIAAALSQAAETLPFDFVISDLGLPDGTGLELMAKLQLLQPGLRGIALSGYGMDEDIRRSAESGFLAHLVKPIDFHQLTRTLRDLSKHAAERRG